MNFILRACYVEVLCGNVIARFGTKTVYMMTSHVAIPNLPCSGEEECENQMNDSLTMNMRIKQEVKLN